MLAIPAVLVERFGDRRNLWPALAALYGVASAVAGAAIAAARPDALVQLPALVLLAWATTAAVALACSGQWYVHQRFSESLFVRHNEVGGFIVAVVAALYGVLLGFMTVVAWQHFSDSRQLVRAESAAATDAWHTAIGMPAGERSRVRQDVLRYATAMIDREWPAMRDRGYDREADWIVMDAIGSAGGFVPRNIKEGNAQSATLQQLGVLHDDRQQRLANDGSGISWFEWTVLLIGAACVCAFCWLFGLENRDIHLVMTGAVAVIVTTTLVLLFELQYPFQSDLRVDPTDWTGVIAHIHTMEAGPQPGMRM